MISQFSIGVRSLKTQHLQAQFLDTDHTPLPERKSLLFYLKAVAFAHMNLSTAE